MNTRRWGPGEVVANGRKVIVWALASDGVCLAKGFFGSLDQRDQAKVQNLFDMLAEQGVIKNREKFKKLEGDLWEFKSGQIRLPCFFDSKNRVVVTHGFRKKADEIPPREIDRADGIKKAYVP